MNSYNSMNTALEPRQALLETVVNERIVVTVLLFNPVEGFQFKTSILESNRSTLDVYSGDVQGAAINHSAFVEIAGE